jgi:two-component system cell cycle sensor histidine kinase/response regulator CckA
MAVVLIAEDEPAIRKLAGLALTSVGYQVLTAANGVEAVALFRSTPDRIDLVITDLRMPVMDGYQLVRLVRQTRPKAKVICMSGYAADGVPADVTFLAKPFTPASLRACAEQALGMA